MTAKDPATIRKPASVRPDWAVALGLGAFLAALYLVSYSGVSHSPDEWYFLTGTEAIVDGNWAQVQAHGWLFSLLVAPFYVLPRLLPGVGSFQSSLLFSSLITALTAVTLFWVLRLFEVTQRMRLLTALMYGVATFAWVYSRYLFREPTAGLLLLLTTWALLSFWRKPRLGLLLAGALTFVCAVLAKKTTLAFLPFYVGLVLAVGARRWLGQGTTPTDEGRLRLDRRRGIALLALLAAIAVITAPWWLRIIPEYARQAPKLPVFAALLISPGWGLLSFNPVLCLAVIGALPFTRRYPVAGTLAIGGSLFYILESTTHPVWWGAWGFGPRQMLPVVPLLCLAIPAGIAVLRKWGGRYGAGLVWLLALASISIQTLGVIVPFNQYVVQELLPAKIFEQDVTWNWRLWPITGMIRFWRPWLVDVAWVQGRADQLAQVKWSVLLPAAALALAALAWLIYAQSHRSAALRWQLWAPVLLIIAWIPAAGWTLRHVYQDERYHPDTGYQAAANTLVENRRAGDVLVTDLWAEHPYEMLTGLINYCRSDCPPRLDLERQKLPYTDGDWRTVNREKLQSYRHAWLALEHLPEGDPESVVEQWLDEVGYLERCTWSGPQVRLCRYSIAAGCSLAQQDLGVRFGQQIVLNRVIIGLDRASPGASLDCTSAPVSPGDTLQVELGWEALDAITDDYKVSVQLLDANGRLVWGMDRRPANGFRPTTAWQPGAAIVDRYAVELPDDITGGRYILVARIYDAMTMAVLPASAASGHALGDAVELAAVEIR